MSLSPEEKKIGIVHPAWVVAGIRFRYTNRETSLSVIRPVYLDVSTDRFGSAVNATLFENRETARTALDNCDDTDKYQLVLGVRVVHPSVVLSIRKHTLRKRAKELWGLRVNSPIGIIADRYEDAGMMESAKLLRSRITS